MKPEPYDPDAHDAAMKKSRQEELGLPIISEPDMPGGFKGDIWFGHSEKRSMGTHRWDGEKWIVLPSEIEVLLILLAKAREERDHYRIALQTVSVNIQRNPDTWRTDIVKYVTEELSR